MNCLRTNTKYSKSKFSDRKYSTAVFFGNIISICRLKFVVEIILKYYKRRILDVPLDTCRVILIYQISVPVCRCNCDSTRLKSVTKTVSCPVKTENHLNNLRHPLLQMRLHCRQQSNTVIDHDREITVLGKTK